MAVHTNGPAFFGRCADFFKVCTQFDEVGLVADAAGDDVVAVGNHGGKCGLDVGVGVAARHRGYRGADAGGGAGRQQADGIALGAFVFGGDGHHAGGFGGRHRQAGLGGNRSLDGFADGIGDVAGGHRHHQHVGVADAHAQHALRGGIAGNGDFACGGHAGAVVGQRDDAQGGIGVGFNGGIGH